MLVFAGDQVVGLLYVCMDFSGQNMFCFRFQHLLLNYCTVEEPTMILLLLPRLIFPPDSKSAVVRYCLGGRQHSYVINSSDHDERRLVHAREGGKPRRNRITIQGVTMPPPKTNRRGTTSDDRGLQARNVP